MKKKILTLALALVMVISMLCSCGVNSEEANLQILEVAQAALKNQGYCITTHITYSANDQNLQSVIARIENCSTVLNVDGEDFSVESNTTIDGISANRGYYVTGDMLYALGVLVIDDEPTYIRKKAQLDENLKAQAASSLGLGLGLSYDDFETYEGKGDLEKCTITCTGLKEEVLVATDETLGGTLKEAGYELTLKDATLTIQIEGGQFKNVTLTYNYFVMSQDGEVYNMTATLVSEFTVYSGAITPPFKTDDYHLVSYENALK